MIKKLFVGPLLVLFGLSINSFAGKPLTAEAPINDHCTAGCVAISTSAWTAIPTSACTGRTGLYLSELSTNTANMAGTLDNSVGVGVRPIFFQPGITQFHGASDQEPFYLLSLHTATETACYEEVKQ